MSNLSEKIEAAKEQVNSYTDYADYVDRMIDEEELPLRYIEDWEPELKAMKEQL